MRTERSASKSLDYNVGALVVLVISVGVAVIVYSVQIILFDLFNIPAWVFGPLGVYTFIYSFAARKDPTYYLVWGTVMFAVAVVSAFYNIISPLIILGILLIVIAVIGIVAYTRSRK